MRLYFLLSAGDRSFPPGPSRLPFLRTRTVLFARRVSVVPSHFSLVPEVEEAGGWGEHPGICTDQFLLLPPLSRAEGCHPSVLCDRRQGKQARLPAGTGPATEPPKGKAWGFGGWSSADPRAPGDTLLAALCKGGPLCPQPPLFSLGVGGAGNYGSG